MQELFRLLACFEIFLALHLINHLVYLCFKAHRKDPEHLRPAKAESITMIVVACIMLTIKQLST